MSQSPKIAFVGAGAQGAGIAADLTKAGLDVTLIDQWPAHVDAMNSRGVEVRMAGRTEITPVRALHLCQVAELRDTFDIVFILVKAYDTRWATELIKPLIAVDGVVVGLQNGMSLDDIASIVGVEQTVGAVIEQASNMFEPGIVNRQNGPETAWFAVGSLDPAYREVAVRAEEVLRHAGTVEVSDDIRSSKWMKLIANAGELVPTAILNLPMAEASEIPEMREFMVECGKEAARAAIADGNRLVPIMGMSASDVTEPDQFAADLLDMVLAHFAFPDTLTTVLQDWLKGRRAEVEEINGLVVSVLEKHGQRAPYNERVLTLARQIEAGELAADPANLDLLVKGVQTVDA